MKERERRKEEGREDVPKYASRIEYAPMRNGDDVGPCETETVQEEDAEAGKVKARAQMEREGKGDRD